MYAKQNQADSNVLMRENTTEETNNLKEEFGKQIQDIEKESNEKQEPKSVDEMILEQLQLLRDVNFVQQNYDAVSKAVHWKSKWIDTKCWRILWSKREGNLL